MNIKFDFDYTYKGIYLVRLIIFLLFFYGGTILYSYISNEDIINGLLLATGLIVFIIICGLIGKLLHWKPIW